MTDRELLELAAKAAGHKLSSADDHDEIISNYDYHLGLWVKYKWGWDWFNPHIDAGANRRLQVFLKLGLVPIEDGGWACIRWNHDDQVTLAVDADPNLAVVRAAAAIGKDMP